MSFSILTKNELARVTGDKKCCKVAELAALVKMNGSIQFSNHQWSLTIQTEIAALARKIFLLLKELFGVIAEVLVRRKLILRKNNTYLIRVSSQQGVRNILLTLGLVDKTKRLVEGIQNELLQRECCRRAYLRGIFLGSGSINNPEGTYHLEIICTNKNYAHDIDHLLQKLHLHGGIALRKQDYVVYLKESEQIAYCLNIMGAHSALLDFENIRIFKGMRNEVNRLVNCETANLSKTVNASIRQVENINLIERKLGLHKLPSSLREIAEARILHPDASLRELGNFLEPKLGKSGVNHRLRKLEEIARKLENDSSASG